MNGHQCTDRLVGSPAVLRRPGGATLQASRLADVAADRAVRPEGHRPVVDTRGIRGPPLQPEPLRTAVARGLLRRARGPPTACEVKHVIHIDQTPRLETTGKCRSTDLRGLARRGRPGSACRGPGPTSTSTASPRRTRREQRSRRASDARASAPTGRSSRPQPRPRTMSTLPGARAQRLCPRLSLPEQSPSPPASDARHGPTVIHNCGPCRLCNTTKCTTRFWLRTCGILQSSAASEHVVAHHQRPARPR